MRILQLIQKIQNRGAETFVCQLSYHLENKGHEVKIVSLYDGDANLPYNPPITILNSNPSNRFLDYKAWKHLSVIINDFKPDIVQANAGDTLKYAVFSKLFFKWRVPIIFRNASEVGRYLKSPFQKIYNNFLFKKTDYVISVSQASKKDILNHFAFLEEITEVIPVGLENDNAIATHSFEPLNAKHIIHVGGFSFEKNHEGLIRIFNTITSQNSQAHLHLVGDGPMRDKIERLVKKKNLDSKVHFHGYKKEPLPFIKAADVLVLPSIIEGLPGVLLEGMYCKTPVVAYNVGGVAEIVNADTGTLVKKGAESDFSESVLKILNGHNEKKTMNAHDMVSQHYMNEQISKNFIDIYSRMIDIPANSI